MLIPGIDMVNASDMDMLAVATGEPG